jgi:hypothetical protein
MTIWYILSGFGIMYQEKSGSPVATAKIVLIEGHVYKKA